MFIKIIPPETDWVAAQLGDEFMWYKANWVNELEIADEDIKAADAILLKFTGCSLDVWIEGEDGISPRVAAAIINGGTIVSWKRSLQYLKSVSSSS